jgi:hypothetical protein
MFLTEVILKNEKKNNVVPLGVFAAKSPSYLILYRTTKVWQTSVDEAVLACIGPRSVPRLQTILKTPCHDEFI